MGAVEPAGPRSLGARFAKRSFDLLAASLGLIVLSPLLIGIAVAIKLDSPGTVFFRQRRIGRDGRPFGMLKFRTMVQDADDRKHEVLHLNERDGLFKISRDPRTTRFGAFLRSTSFDELPQLIHVVRGEMSLVGPRPLIAEEDEQIPGQFRRRLSVRPGMTGPWQVAGPASVPLPEMAALDNDYVDEQSFFGDISLILRTIPHVVLRRGA